MRVAVAVAVSAVALAGCASGFSSTPTPPPWSLPSSSRVPAPPSEAERLGNVATEITITPVPREELIRVVGVRRLRAIEPAWLFLRARVAPVGPAAADLDVELSLEAAAGAELPESDHSLLALAELTGERPRDHVYRYLRTSNAPWPAHVLTFGILTILTLRVDREVVPPSEAEVRAAAPRAIALEAALRATCPRAGGCERIVVIRRPLDETQPLSLVARAVVRGRRESLMRRVVVPLPDGARLDERIVASGGQLRPVEPAPPRSGPAALARIPRNLPLAPWPAKQLASIEIPPPPSAPARPQTPEASAAARPVWAKDAKRYAPEPPLALLDPTLPVEDRVEGGVVRCDVGDLSIPGDDTDHVYAEARLGRRWWRVGGRSSSLSLATLGPREALSLALFDWDWLSGDDHLVTLSARRVPGRGGAMSATFGAPDSRRGYATMECRLFGRAAVERATAAAWVRAVDALEGIEEDPIAVRPDEKDLGATVAGVPAARDAVEELAGLVGWGDPRVNAAGARYEAGEKRYYLAARRAIEALPGDERGVVVLGKETRPPSVRVRAVESQCGAEALAALRKSTRVSLRDAPSAWRRSPCVVRVTVENIGERREYTSSMIDTRLILDDGRPLDLSSVSHTEVQPGAQAIVSLIAEKGPPPPSLASKPWRLAVYRSGVVELWPIR